MKPKLRWPYCYYVLSTVLTLGPAVVSILLAQDLELAVQPTLIWLVITSTTALLASLYNIDTMTEARREAENKK